MPIFNYKAKEIIVKIVYYGPGLCGKTTSLQRLHEETIPERKGELYFLATETDQTIYFELLPLLVGEIKDFKLRFQVYTVPGQVKYNNTRKIVLQGVDAIVFVADSQRSRRQPNLTSLENLKYNLKGGYNILLKDVPLVFEYNKRDMKDLLTVAELNQDLNPRNLPYFETIAIEGQGVLDAFEAISGLAIQSLETRLLQLERKASPSAFKGIQQKLMQSLKLPQRNALAENPADSDLESSKPGEFAAFAGQHEDLDFTDDAKSLFILDDEEKEPETRAVQKEEEKGPSYLDIFAMTYHDGDVIFEEGDEGNEMYFVEDGRVRIVGSYKLTKKVLAIYEKGDFFGEMVLFGGKTRSATAVAVGMTRILPVTRETLASQIQSRPEIAMALLETLSNRIRNDGQTIGKLADHNKELRKRLIQVQDLAKQLMEQNKHLKQQAGRES